ncbi:MAG: response regulator, partial [Deltaproteobacteria bacterium]|nr:response regulator [Deltaproteobacteria bacterium]
MQYASRANAVPFNFDQSFDELPVTEKMMANRVLLVDDDADILAAIKRKFRKQFHIDTALSGKEGLKLVAANGPYDVIVSDFQMPEMHGIEFFSRVKKIAPHTIRIMLTGHADLPAVIQAINDGNVFRFLLKPCPTNALAEAITKGIEQYEEIVTHHNYINRTRTSLALAREVQNDLMP